MRFRVDRGEGNTDRMETKLSQNTQRAALVSILLICLATYGIGSARTGFQGKDELRYAQIAKEMQKPGDYFFLHYQGLVYPDKPPLYFWMVRVCYGLTGGVSPWGIRAPLILCTLLTVLLTFDMGRRLFNPRAALLAALFYGLSFRPIWSVRTARLDPPLVLFTTLALWFVVRGLGRAEEGKRPALRDTIGFWAAMALGFLIKGPLGLILPGGVLLVYRAVRWKWRGAVGWSTLLGAVVFLALLALWIVPGLHYGGWKDYFGVIWDQEVVGRSSDPWRHTKDGFLHNCVYYVGRLGYEFLPGILFLPGALALAWRRRGSDAPGGKRLAFVLSWFFFVLVFFTLMKSKRPQYILPLYPAAGLLVGWFLDRVLSGEKTDIRWTKWPLYFYAFLTLAIAAALQFPLPFLLEKFHLAAPLDARLAIAAVLLPLAVLLFVSARKKSLPLGSGAALAVVPGLILVAYLLYFPRSHREEPYRQIALHTGQLTDAGETVYMTRSVRPQFNIWGDYFLRDLTDPDTIADMELIPQDHPIYFPNGSIKNFDTTILGFLLYFPRANQEATSQTNARDTQEEAGENGTAYMLRPVQPQMNARGDFLLRKLSGPDAIADMGVVPEDEPIYFPNGSIENDAHRDTIKRALKAKRNKLTLSAFFHSPKPYLLLISDRDYQAKKSLYQQLKWHLIKTFPMSHNEGGDMHLFSNKENYREAMREWKRKQTPAAAGDENGNGHSQSN